jgi:hypothetical protein
LIFVYLSSAVVVIKMTLTLFIAQPGCSSLKRNEPTLAYWRLGLVRLTLTRADRLAESYERPGAVGPRPDSRKSAGPRAIPKGTFENAIVGSKANAHRRRSSRPACTSGSTFTAPHALRHRSSSSSGWAMTPFGMRGVRARVHPRKYDTIALCSTPRAARELNFSGRPSFFNRARFGNVKRTYSIISFGAGRKAGV